MNRGIRFLLGAGIGSLITWSLTKEYYRRLADEEIASVVNRDRYKEIEPAETEEQKIEAKRKYTEIAKNYQKPSVIDYASKYQTSTSDLPVEIDHPVDDDEERPHVISPEEFGEIDEYDKISLTYYADGYLVEGDPAMGGTIIDNVDEVVGPDALDSFGEYEDDAVYVRNDAHQTDYEILLSEMNFKEE